MQSGLIPKVGTFFILVGIGLTLIFVAYELGGSTFFDYLLIAGILIFIGIRLRARRSDQVATRFSTIRSISEKQKQMREKKNTEKSKNQARER